MNSLSEVTARMLFIERTNIQYNQDTDFGKNPNGKESEIETLLNEWNNLKYLRNQLKNK